MILGVDTDLFKWVHFCMEPLEETSGGVDAAIARFTRG
jgi:hypothetical protein